MAEQPLEAADAVAHAAREHATKLRAYLMARSRDLALAEDALGHAYQKALETWPRQGTPDAPAAWLLTTARRFLGHAARKARVAAAAQAELTRALDEAQERADVDLPDERLGLLLACARDEIAPPMRAPLMLQCVLGLNAARIGSAYLVPPATMGQRLTREKARLKASGLAFAPGERAHMKTRLSAVLEAIYAAYGVAWGDDVICATLSSEALWLARLTARLAPDDAEAQGLLALVLFCESRRAARRGPGGVYVPLEAQDPALWDAAMIDEAVAALAAANKAPRTGRFQLEAAIQSLHASRRQGGAPPYEAIAATYQALLRLAPSVGAQVGCAGALRAAGDAAGALALLHELPPRRVEGYQPFWAVKAHVLADLGRDAGDVFDRAAALAEDPGVRAYLLAQRGAAA